MGRALRSAARRPDPPETEGEDGSALVRRRDLPKVKGRWCYLYRAIDRDGNLVDSMLSATRDMAAAQRFFRSARGMVNATPTQVTTAGHDSYPRAIREVLGPEVQHRCSAY